MLIPSPRHRPEDLDLWRRLEECDRDNYRLDHVEEKAERAVEDIRRFAVEGPCYVGVSWGKDSVVVAHLVAAHGLPCPALWLREGEAANPECEAVAWAFTQRWPNLRYREVLIEYRPENLETPDATVFRALAAAAGTDRYITGLRAEESRVRRMRYFVHGVSTRRTCAPLSSWKAKHVFAYLAHHDLPTHPVYAMLGGGRWSRDRVRTAMLGGGRGRGMGREEWEREYYGDVLRRLEATLGDQPR